MIDIVGLSVSTLWLKGAGLKRIDDALERYADNPKKLRKFSKDHPVLAFRKRQVRRAA